ncbi:hypothetical protein, partial [Vibrio vulnificus]
MADDFLTNKGDFTVA